MKKLTMMAMVLLAALLAACGTGKTDSSAGGGETAAQPVFTDLVAAVKDQLAADLKDDGVEDVDQLYQEADLTGEAEANSAEAIWIEKMKLDPDKLENGTVIAALMNVNADEIILLEAKTEAETDALKTSLENELAAQTQTWEHYLPEQHEKVKNNKIVTKGKYLLYVTYSDPDKIEDVFNSQFK